MNPKLVKYIAFGIGGLVVVILLVWLVSSVVKSLKKSDLEKDLKREIDEKNLSFDESKYQQMASALLIAMENMTTDEDTIYRTLSELKTADDWKQLQLVFGEKNGKNLISYLIDDLDNSEIKKVNTILSKFNQSI